MSNQVAGVCQEVKAKQTKIGTMYDLVVNGKSYGVGKYPPKCKAGDNVVFDIAWRGEYPNVDTKTLQTTPGTGAPVHAQIPYVDNRQEVISRQSALNSSIAWVTVLLGLDSKRATPEAADAVLVKYRNAFYKASTGKSWLEEKDEPAEPAKPAAQENPFKDDSGWV
jgi:hypothetical protein